jgi:hypothetical protein
MARSHRWAIFSSVLPRDSLTLELPNTGVYQDDEGLKLHPRRPEAKIPKFPDIIDFVRRQRAKLLELLSHM